MRNVSGVSLWSVIQFLDLNYTIANAVEFHADDGWVSWNVSLTDVESEASKVLIIYKQDGEFLDPDLDEGDGYLMAIVDFSLTDPDSSSKFGTKFLTGIDFITI
jgi:hypothetical protein